MTRFSWLSESSTVLRISGMPFGTTRPVAQIVQSSMSNWGTLPKSRELRVSNVDP